MRRGSGIRTGSGSDWVALHSVVLIFQCLWFSLWNPVATAPGSDIAKPLFNVIPFSELLVKST